jgi:uncharacterized membrane protein
MRRAGPSIASWTRRDNQKWRLPDHLIDREKRATMLLIMMLLFLHLIFAPWRRFRDAVDHGALPEAARSLNQIRIIVGINLLLGVLTIVIGGSGRYI